MMKKNAFKKNMKEKGLR